MAFVLDASVALAFASPDEDNAETRRLLRLFQTSAVYVPALWPTELANGLLVAERKGRLSAAEIDMFALQIKKLNIRLTASSLDQSLVISIARQEALTVYDATYLQLAMEEQLPLATFDTALRLAAAHQGVALL